jgi:hypothetical protein
MASQICSQRVTHKNKIERPSYKHRGSTAEKHAHTRIFNSETERKPTTWIVTHDVVDAPEYLPCILHNGCEELRFIYQRQTYIRNIGRGIVLLEFRRDSDIIPVMNSFRFAMRSDMCAGHWPHEVAIGAGTAVPLRVRRSIRVVVKGVQWCCAMVLAAARHITIAVIAIACALSSITAIITARALPSFTAITAIITACALPSFTATPFIITTYVSLGFYTFRMMDDVGEDAFKDLKGIVLVGGTFCGIFLESSPPLTNYAPRAFEFIYYSVNVAMYRGQNMVHHKFNRNLWDPEA